MLRRSGGVELKLVSTGHLRNLGARDCGVLHFIHVHITVAPLSPTITTMATISPLDEIEWYDPHLIPTLGMGPQLNTNNILWYFANSPYFDHSSNNSALVQHAASAPNRDAIFFNRHNFETELRERFPTGRQFVVVSEPKAEGEPWVIQKQNKSYDKDKNIVVEAEATYYTIGTSIFKAPSLGDVMKSRLVCSPSVLSIMLDMIY